MMSEDTLSLPFWDDFSFSNIVASPDLWENSDHVFINSALGINPPTINVATFDGSQGDGSPHSDIGVSSKDALESHAIDLSYDVTDNVVLSFYWQMGGNGDRPERRDTLSVWFWTDEHEWERVRFKPGTDENFSDEFQIETIPITLEKYLHEGFKFRFETKGNNAGAFDTWHVDYVYLNRDRPTSNESLDDHAISQPATTIFQPYTMIPREQLFAFPDTIFRDINVTLSSFENSVHTVTYTYSLHQYNPNDDALLSTLFSQTPTEGAPLVSINEKKTYTIPALDASIFNPADNSIYLYSQILFITNDEFFKLEDNGGGVIFLNDEFYNYRLNDTARYYFEIDELLAYDDGTAELSAGLNVREGKLAMKYNLAVADTLTHIDIYFPKVNGLPTNDRFNLSVQTGLDSTTLIKQEFLRYDTVVGNNQFHSFEFRHPPIVGGDFYVVFEQFSNDYFPIGLDVNTDNTDKLFFNLGNEWKSDSVLNFQGSLMIRPRFSELHGVYTQVQKKSDPIIRVYPNPSKEFVRIEGTYKRFELYNMTGRLLISGLRDEIDVRDLPEGLYLLKVHGQFGSTTRKLTVDR
jgi:hypothetical protein